MSFYRRGSHTVYDCRYHVVWITKYRKKWLHKKLQPILEWILKDICEDLYIKVIRIWMEEDHVHMYVSIPLETWHIPEVVQKLKWLSSKKLWEIDWMDKYFKKFYWKDWIWKRARWYFVCTIWEVNDETIKKYVEEQWMIEEKELIV